jgi:Txe/YoeB family toxin of toxin-antitoxin system
VVAYTLVFTKAAADATPKLKAAKLDQKARALLDILREEPFRSPPPFETLRGDLRGMFSRRINRQHRLVYTVIEESKTVKIISMWSHYEF